MSDGLEAKVKIDDKFRAALLERKNGLNCRELSEQLVKKGHKTTPDMLSGILRVNSIRKVPYDLYVEFVPEEPKGIHWKESIDFASNLAKLCSYLSDIDNKEFAGQLAEELNQHGLQYVGVSLLRSLFNEGRISNINPIITDILVKKFEKTTPKSSWGSLDEIEEFVNSLGPVPPGEHRPYRVSWDEAGPVVYELQRLRGLPFATIVGKKGTSRKKFERGERVLSLEEYHDLQRETREIPKYRQELMQLLVDAKDRLQNTRLDNIRVEHIKDLPDNLVLNEEELQLVNIGQQNYGEEAFMRNIFPHYVRMKEEYYFPIECFEMLVRHPKTISALYRRELNAFAECVDDKLVYYKEGILDINKSRGYNIGVTKDGIRFTLEEAMRKFNRDNNIDHTKINHKNTNLFSSDLLPEPVMVSSYSNTLRLP